MVCSGMDATEVVRACEGKTPEEQAAIIERYGRACVHRFLSEWPRRKQTNKGNPYIKTGYNHCIDEMLKAHQE